MFKYKIKAVNADGRGVIDIITSHTAMEALSEFHRKYPTFTVESYELIEIRSL